MPERPNGGVLKTPGSHGPRGFESHSLRVERDPTDVLRHVLPGSDVVVPLANGEPRALIAALDEHAGRLRDVRVHQMHALHDHPYLHGVHGDRLRHVSYFLSEVTRPAYAAGTCDLVPAHFSEVPLLLRRNNRRIVVLAAAAPPDRHGYFSLGTNADYVASFVGKVPVYLQVTEHMPRTFGGNNLHVSQVAGWVETDEPLVEVEPAVPDDLDRAIAGYVAERVPDGATVQAGIGAIPNAVLSALHGHRDLGVHTELVSDGFMELFEAGVVTGTRKATRPGKIVTTFCLGTRSLYSFLHENPAVELQPVEWVNDPRVIGRESHFVSINATVEVDLLGQCNSEWVGDHYHSGSGGQADFARGAMYSEHGQGFVTLRSTTRHGTSKIVPRLAPAAPVTTLKNTVDHVVTEYGVAKLRGRPIAERARALVEIAHPDHREALDRAAHELGHRHPH